MDEQQKVRRALEDEQAVSIRADLRYDLNESPFRLLREDIYNSVQNIAEEVRSWADDRDSDMLAPGQVCEELERARRLVSAPVRLDEDRGGGLTALRLVTEDEARSVDPVEEIREGVETLDRLMTNPLLSEYALRALQATRTVLERRLPRKEGIDA